jgi:hypothetical protein
MGEFDELESIADMNAADRSQNMRGKSRRVRAAWREKAERGQRHTRLRGAGNHVTRPITLAPVTDDAFHGGEPMPRAHHLRD